MGWIALSDAERRGPSLPVWLRRIESGTLPHYLDPSSGRRMVWVDGAAPTAAVESGLEQVLERLERLERLLTGGQWTTVRRAAARAISPAQPISATPRRRSAPPPIAPRRAPSPPPAATPPSIRATAPAPAAKPKGSAPKDVIRLHELAGTDRAAAELLGRNRSEFWRWRTGKRKIGKANLERVRGAIADLQSRKAA